jgi:hypothetical protein
MSNLYDRLLKKEAELAVIGLGYVGLPIALAFARRLKVVGFDINQKRVDMMRRGEDPSNEIPAEEFEGCDIHFTADIEELRSARFFIVAVPTPIDQQNIPDLGPLLGATRTVGQVLKKGDYVVYESTVYPGCTEEDCVPLLERLSSLKFVDGLQGRLLARAHQSGRQGAHAGDHREGDQRLRRGERRGRGAHVRAGGEGRRAPRQQPQGGRGQPRSSRTRSAT